MPFGSIESTTLLECLDRSCPSSRITSIANGFTFVGLEPAL
jgi:hypothetical protein